MQRRLYNKVKSETKASLILHFTGNVHLPWKDHCLLQLRAAGSAKARGNVIGQWLSGKQYNAISTSASQLDLFCPMTHVGKAGSFRISQGLAPKPCSFYTLASAAHMVTLCIYLFFVVLSSDTTGTAMLKAALWPPQNMKRAPKRLLIRPLLHTRMVSPESSKGPMEKDNSDDLKYYP